ncbi:hypothetical protein MRX96_048156 [Rhipicephalus microplus]
MVDDDSSSSTTVEDSEMDAGSPTPCDLCYLSRAAKQNAVIELARARKVDILVPQETYVHRLGQIRSFDATFGTRSYWGYGASGSRGVAIVLMPRFTGSVLCYFRDTDGRLMWMDPDSGIRIVNLYAPNDFRSQKDFFAALDNHLVGPSRVVLVGGFQLRAISH